MEDIAQAMKDNPHTQTPSAKPNLLSAPSNYAWPQHNSDHRSSQKLRREKTEHREKYKTWNVEKVNYLFKFI